MNNTVEIETDDIVFVWKEDSTGIEEIILPVIPITAMVEDNVAYSVKIILTPVDNKE